MEKKLNISIALGLSILLIGCQSIGSFRCKAFTPAKESLSFIDDTICIYSWYDILTNKEMADTCCWNYIPGNKISICKKNAPLGTEHPISIDSIEMERLDFIYDVCPKWYNISYEEFEKDPRYKYPIYQKHYTSPYRMPTFYEKYGMRFAAPCDTALIIGDSCLILNTMPASYFVADHKIMKTRRRVRSRSVRMQEEQLYPWLTNTYEYLNYRVNYGKKATLLKDDILDVTFSYIDEFGNKESIKFINDSLCVNITSDTSSTSIPYVVREDTCHYDIKNNLIAINFDTYEDTLYDTLAYQNGILFYSKIYNKPAQLYGRPAYNHYRHFAIWHNSSLPTPKCNLSMIVKPFISEKMQWIDKTDSIQRILTAYYETYVPLNMLHPKSDEVSHQSCQTNSNDLFEGLTIREENDTIFFEEHKLIPIW